jgi:hypothetical protein
MWWVIFHLHWLVIAAKFVLGSVRLADIPIVAGQTGWKCAAQRQHKLPRIVQKSDGGAGAGHYIDFPYQQHRAIHRRCPTSDLEPADPYGMHSFLTICHSL